MNILHEHLFVFVGFASYHKLTASASKMKITMLDRKATIIEQVIIGASALGYTKKCDLHKTLHYTEL